MERDQDVSVVLLHDVLLECRDGVSRGRNNDVPPVVSTTSQTILKSNTQRGLSGMSPRRFSGTCPQRPISTSLRRLLLGPNEIPNNVAVVRLHHVSELPCRDAWFVGFYYVFKLFSHCLHLVGFHISFKYQMRQQIFLVPIRRESRRVVWIIN